MKPQQIGLFGQTIIERSTGQQLPLFHEPVDIKPPPAEASARKWAAAAPATPSMFTPATKPRPARKPRRSLAEEVEARLRELRIPYVSVDEAKKALFANARLKSFHLVVYSKVGDNWLLWCGEPTAAVRTDMDQWAKVFGEGFRVVYALRRAGGIVYRTPEGEEVDMERKARLE